MPLYRKLGNWAFVLSVRLLFGGCFSDLCYGYNAFWRWVLPYLNLNGTGFEIETMMNVRALQAGLKVAEIPSFETDRVYGASRLQTIPDGWRILKTIVRERIKGNYRSMCRKVANTKRARLITAPLIVVANDQN
jgi:hypothetical protein